MSIGKVWLVGAGPGDPGLLTLRGHDALRRADIVFHDALSHPALLSICHGAELRDVGKRFGRPSTSQAWITSELIEQAQLGKRVVRLKGGDPFLFARGAEEVMALHAARIPFEIVPGISSPVAASAYAGISLTHRTLSSSVTFITGSDRLGVEWSAEAWKKLATATDTICVLMGMRRIESITGALMAGGRARETPAAVVQWGARPNQRTLVGTLGDIAERVRDGEVANPAVIIIGDVVALREQLRWFDRLPLFGRNILVLRAEPEALETAACVRARGANPVVFPVIEIGPAPDPRAVAEAVQALANYQWVVFTSANGVRRFFAEITSQGKDARVFGSARLAAIGPKTAEALETRGLRADLVAQEYVAEGLVKDLLATGPLGRVLIPRALEARDVLPDSLRGAGAHVETLPVYATRTRGPERSLELRRLFESGGVDVAMFSSGSTVDAVMRLLGGEAQLLLGEVTVASIGPVTRAALEHAGVRVDVTAARYSIDGLLDALEQHFLLSAEGARSTPVPTTA